MSRSSRKEREAEKAARRAERLAQREDQRARRKAEQARQAAERAARLADRARRKPGRERDLDDSFEDLVDEVAERWSRKAEAWIDEQTGKLLNSNFVDDLRDDPAADVRQNEKAKRDSESWMDRQYRELSGDYDDDLYGYSGTDTYSQQQTSLSGYGDEEAQSMKTGSSRNRHSRRRSTSSGKRRSYSFPSRRRRRSYGNLYRDKEHGKVLGVCAGLADYFGRETWQIRLLAVFGLMFFPQITVPAYFITYFLMEDKPYYRQVTDRFDDIDEEFDDEEVMLKRRRQRDINHALNNKEAMRLAKSKFSDLEGRLRAMETHVTSSRFELDREFRKISGEEA